MTDNRQISLFDRDTSTDKPWILVATPFSELGEIICDSLKEVANIEHIQTVSQAISSKENHPDYRQVILDMEFGELNVLNLGKTLRLIYPMLQILIISNEEKPTDLDEILPWMFLHKPFLLRDLEAALGILETHDDLPGKIIDLDTFDNDNNDPIRWSKNARMATRYLGNLIKKSFAQEALLIQNGAVWSYAGSLSEKSVYEVNSVIQKSIGNENNYDFARFIKLEASQSEHALYASLIFVGFILALVFDPDIPFGIVRKQTKKFANTLLLLDGYDIPANFLSSGSAEITARMEGRNISKNQNSFDTTNLNYRGLRINTYSYSDNNSHYSPPPNQPAPEIKEQTQEMDSPVPLNRSKLDGKVVSSSHEFRVMDHETDHDHQESENNQLSFLHEFIPDALYNLTYSCLLIPRFASPHHTSDRELKIEEYIKNVHISYGWRLEQLEVQPEYLRWASSFPPTITPSKHIEKIRKEISRLLFEDFPTLKKENLNDDYWAPGYLIVGGKNLISNQLVLAFLKRNRQKYGVNRDVSSPNRFDRVFL